MAIFDNKQLEIFLAVARTKSFSKAAESLYLSQPTISAHIKNLEEDLNTKLFIRSTKEITLTPSGTALLPYVLKFMSLKEEALNHLDKLNTEVEGNLIISASTVPSQYLVPKFLPDFLEKYPKLNLTVKQSDSHQVLENIKDFGADLGICALSSNKAPLVYIPLIDDPLVIVTPNTPQFAQFSENLPVEEIMHQSFISREEGSGTKKESDSLLEAMGVDLQKLRQRVQLNSTEAVLQGVKQGLGISFVSKRAAQDFIELGYIKAFEIADQIENRTIYLVHHKNHPLSPAAEAFIAESLAYFNPF
ncbi:MAG: LysR family transcriptional regulator [Firmicutes bacterium]|nr:LysR family transcriptional regulator [Bacillota bacterium]